MDRVRTEALRNEQAKLALEAKQERELRELKDRQRIELERTIEHHQTVKGDLDKAYEVALSTAHEQHEERLTSVRNNQAKQLADEKAKGDEEVEKVRTRYQEQIARYRENSEKTLNELRSKTDQSAENIKRARERGRA